MGPSQIMQRGKPDLYNPLTTLYLIVLSSEFLDLSGLVLSLSGTILLCSGLLGFLTYVRSSFLFKNPGPSVFGVSCPSFSSKRPEAKFLVPDWGEVVDSGMGLL
jgi:hypothetical protein